MQKKIIALAIASALAVPAVAMADNNVTLYGQANMSIDIVNDGAAASATTNRLVNNASRLGVKGTEDLGGGLAVVYQAEGSANLGSNFSFDRNTFVGLSSADMGTALVGQHDTPYKISTRDLDLFADTVAADNRNLMGNNLHDARLNNVIAYISPAMSGLTVAAATVFGAESAISGQTKGGAMSIAGMYNAGPFYGTVAYQNVKAGSPNSGYLAAGGTGSVFGTSSGVDDEAKALKVGGSYTMDAFKVNLVGEQVTYTDKAASIETKNTNYYVAAKYNLDAANAVKLAYATKGDTKDNGVKNTDNVKQVSLGYDHDMSKRTTAYALYTKVTDNAAGNPDPSTISVGLKHAF
jgi:predicted porin